MDRRGPRHVSPSSPTFPRVVVRRASSSSFPPCLLPISFILSISPFRLSLPLKRASDLMTKPLLVGPERSGVFFLVGWIKVVAFFARRSPPQDVHSSPVVRPVQVLLGCPPMCSSSPLASTAPPLWRQRPNCSTSCVRPPPWTNIFFPPFLLMSLP